PLHDLAQQARRDVDDLEQQSAAARGRLRALLEEESLDDQQVADHRRAATQALTDIARVRPLQRQAVDVARQLARVERVREESAARLRQLQERADEVPAALEQAIVPLAAAQESVVTAEALTRDLEVLRGRVRAARSAEAIGAQLATAGLALAEATQARLLARETLVELREQRLDGMAAEIAGKLAVG
ncbi:unnamed protein product, partial [Phaeothamnion confervicola]